ncbi:MAG: WecB/TagA/CpsF family glycosyltransferase [Candidatus Moraniibacteriota bacterium]
MDIFGIPIDNLTRTAMLARAKEFLAKPRFHRIATVNPEFLLRAEKDTVFRKTILDADLRVADGFGIVLAGWLRGRHITRFPGADLMEAIIRIANDRGLLVYLATRKDGLSSFQEVKLALLKKYPNIKIEGSEFDSKSYKLPTTNCQFILCNFGAPQQEIFLDSLKNQKSIRLAMGVGGSFDYLTGKIKRAPEWMRASGLEWLWRLMLQPKRFTRIWNAVIVFPFRVFFATMNK